jgi:sugar lactone lactonase YvrE
MELTKAIKQSASVRINWRALFIIVVMILVYQDRATAQIINTYAGGATTLAVSPNIDPGATTVDSVGNVYFSDGHYRIRKLAPNGVTTIVAGTGVSGYNGEGLATKAQISGGRLAIDKDGNLFIADGGNHRIRKVTPAGIISTVAGNGVAGFSGDGGLAVDARLNAPSAIAVSTSGQIYISDLANRRIRVVTSGGLILPFAGKDTIAISGDGGPAINAGIGAVFSLALRNNTLYLADYGNNRIRTIGIGNGIINAFAGNGAAGFFGDGGDAINASLGAPIGLSFDASGNLYFADSGNHRVRRITPSRIISTVVGTGTPAYFGDGGPGIYTSLYLPWDVAVGPGGKLYIADLENHRIRVMDSAGIVTTAAGTGDTDLGVGDGSVATGALLREPSGIAFDTAGNAYITEFFGNRLRKVTPAGVISTIAGLYFPRSGGDGGLAKVADLNNPWSVVADSLGNVYVSEYSGHRVRKIDASGYISTVAGTGVNGYNGDGIEARSAQLSFPMGLTLDGENNLYIADNGNARVRRVSPAGIISTVAGNGIESFAGDGGPAISASLSHPSGVDFDRNGDLWIADWGNNRFRKVSATTGLIATVVGTGVAGNSGDGGLATNATLDRPYNVKFDASGNAYIAAGYSFAVRKVTPSGVISTAAGTGVNGFSGDGGLATNATMGYVTDVALDAGGNLYIANGSNNRIRRVTAEAVTNRADDLSGDGKSDLLVRDGNTGQVEGWLMDGSNIAIRGTLIGPGGWTVTHAGDLNGDGNADVLARHSDGRATASLMNGVIAISSVNLLAAGTGWIVAHVADFNGDGKKDLLMRNTLDNSLQLWLMDGLVATSVTRILGGGATYVPTHVADINGDGKADILFRNTESGVVTSWLMDGARIVDPWTLRTEKDWVITHTADFNGDGKIDLLWRNTVDGSVESWLMNGATPLSTGFVRAPSTWTVTHVGDLNGDGKADIIWRNPADGTTDAWLVNGTQQSSAINLMPASMGWTMKRLGDYNGDGKSDLIWQNDVDGRIVMWQMDGLVATSVKLVAGEGRSVILP